MLAAGEHSKQSSKQKIKAPRAAAPAAACVAGRSPGQHMLPQQALKTNGNSVPPQNKKLKPLVLPLLRRHAWLAAPAANTCSGNNPQNKRQQRPPTKQKIKAPRAAAPAAACVAGRSCGQHMLPQQPSKQTATAPPHKTKNQSPSCCRSCGGMRGWPLLRPTHAPATTLKTNGNSAPPQNKKSKPLVLPLLRRHVARNLTPSCRPLLRRHVARKTNPLVRSSPEVARSPENQPPSCRPLLRRHVARKLTPSCRPLLRRHVARQERTARGRLVFRATCHLRRGPHEGVSFPGYVPPQERTARGG